MLQTFEINSTLQVLLETPVHSYTSSVQYVLMNTVCLVWRAPKEHLSKRIISKKTQGGIWQLIFLAITKPEECHMGRFFELLFPNISACSRFKRQAQVYKGKKLDKA